MPEITPPPGYVPAGVPPPSGYTPDVPPPAGYVAEKARAHLAGSMGAEQIGKTAGPGVGDFLNRAFNPVPVAKRIWQEHVTEPLRAADEAAAPYVQQVVEAPRQAAEQIAPGFAERALGPAGMGAYKGFEGFTESLATPTNVALGAAISQAPKALARLAAAGFSIDMLKGAISSDPELSAAWEAKDIPRLLELGIPKLGQLAMAGAAGAHAAGGVPRFGRAAATPPVEPARVTPEEALPRLVPEKSTVAPVPEKGTPIPEKGTPDILSRENLQAAYRLPDERVISTGTNHDVDALPAKYRRDFTGVEPGFVNREGAFVTLGDLQNTIVAGARGGAGEATIGEAEAAPPTEDLKQQAQQEFGVDFDELARQAQEARDAASLQRAEAGHEAAVPELAARGLAEREDRAGTQPGDLLRQGQEALPLGRGRAAGAVKTEEFDPEVQKRLDAEEAVFEADRQRIKAARIANTDIKPEIPFTQQVEQIEKAAEETNPLSEKIGLRMKHGTPDGAEPERNYVNRPIIGNDALKQTQRAAPESAEKWRTVPVAPKRAGHVMTDAYQKVNEAYGSREGWDVHKRVVTASQLAGKANDYANLAADVAGMAPEQTIKFYGDQVNALVDAIGSKARFKTGRINEIRVTADKLFRKGDGEGLRDHLTDVFTRAAEAAQASSDAVDLGGKALEEWVQDPAWQRANRAYKATLGKLLEEEHAEHQGRFLSADSLGPAQTYMPLLAPREGTWGRVITAFRRPFAPRSNPWNRMRTGLSQEYDLGNEALTHAVGRGLRSLATKDALETDRKLGLIQDIKESEATPSAFAYQGRSFVRSEPFETTSPKMVLREGERPGQIPPKRAITPEWHHKEIRQILGGERQDWQNPAMQAARDAITKSALYGAFDMAFHSTNVAATALSRVPVIGSNPALRVAQQVPGFGLLVKPVALAEHLRKMDPFSDEARGRSGLTGKELFDRLAEAGAIPDRYARETYSKEISKATGAKVRRYNLAPALVGPKGIDIRGRMLFADDLLTRNPKATDSDINQFVNNLGNYVYQLNSPHMRAVKKAGLSSFVTAGKTMNINAVQSLLATGREPTRGAEFVKGKAQLLANSSVIAAAATWVALHKAYTGEYPWEDPDSKLLAIPVKNEDRDAPWAKWLFSNQERESGKPLYISPTDLLQPFSGRGLRALGMRAFLETLYRGGSTGQALEHATTEAANTAIHPYAGPVAQAASRLAGIEPYIQTQHERGRPVLSFRSSVQEDTPPGLPTWWARGRSAVFGLNPSLRGFEWEPEPGKGPPQERPPFGEQLSEGARYTASQVLTPRLARHHTSMPSAEAKRLRKEQIYFQRRGLD